MPKIASFRPYLLMFISWLTVSSFLAGQDTFSKKHIIGISPLDLLAESYSVHYGRYLSHGIYELNFPIYYSKKSDDLALLGTGFELRYFRRGSGKGRFLGVGIGVESANWNYKGIGDMEQIRAIIYYPNIEYGRRFCFDNGFCLTLFLRADYKIGQIAASNGEERLARKNGNMQLAFGVDIDFQF